MNGLCRENGFTGRGTDLSLGEIGCHRQKIRNLGPGLALCLKSLAVMQRQTDLDDQWLSQRKEDAKLTQVEPAFTQVYQKSQQKLI